VYPADLEYNRRGVLGPGQRARLKALIASYGSFTFGFSPAEDMMRALTAQLNQSLKDGRVMAATGEVGIDLRAFHAGMVEGEKYDLPGNHESLYCAALDGGGKVKLAQWLDLLPGRYELYVAAQVGFVVGASPLPPFEHAQTFFGSLCAAQGLAAEVLAENRRGRMTESQQSALRSADDAPLGYGCCLFILAAIVGLVPAGRFFGFLWGRKYSTLSIVGAAVGTVFLIVCGIAALVHDRRRRAATLLDAKEGRIATFDGPLQKRLVTGRNSVTRKLQIGAHTFDITERAELYVTLIPGFVYRAYLAPRSEKLIAIELLSQNKTLAVARF